MKCISVFRQAGRNKEAETYYRKAAKLRPNVSILIAEIKASIPYLHI